MDNVFAQIKTTELKGSTFRSRILDFGNFDISEAEFKIVFKKAGNILPLTNLEPQKVGNALVIPYNILESYIGEIRMEAWMTLNGVTDLAMVETMLISAENQLKSDATNQNVSVTFGDVVIPVTFTQSIVNIGGGNGTGADGKSAYEIAVLNGFPGTEAEWLISLNGADGDDFTYEDFTPEQLALLKGEKGDSFEYSDFTPEQLALLKGADGKSAYQIALDNGFVGTQAEWLASLQGSGGGGTAPATTFDTQNNTAAASMKATADYFLGPASEIPYTLTTVNSYLGVNGVVAPSANWRTSELIPVTAGKTYYYYGKISQSTAKAVAGYNSSGVFVAILINTQLTSLTGTPFTVPEGITSVRICSLNDTPLMLKGGTALKAELLPESAPTKIKMKRSWAAVGTSITSEDVTIGGYQTRILEIFEFLSYSNYGRSGHSLGGTTLSDTNSIMNKATGWVFHDIFSMESITNDFKRNIPIGTRADYDNATGITTYFGALRAFKDKVATLNASARIIVANALKRNNGGYTSTSANTAGHTLLDYEKALLEIALLNDWRFIDQNRESGITDDNLAFTTSDGLHPNNFGYRLISKVWIREFWLLSKTG